MRESLLGFLINDFVAGELGTDVMGLFSISIDTFSDTGVLKRKKITILLGHTVMCILY